MSILASFATACGIIIAVLAFIKGLFSFLAWADEHEVEIMGIFILFIVGLLTFVVWRSTNPY